MPPKIDLKFRKSLSRPISRHAFVVKKMPVKKPTYSKDEATKRRLIDIYASQTEKLQQQQFQYRKVLLNFDKKKPKKRFETNLESTNAAVKAFKDNIKANIWVAMNKNYREQAEKHLECIKTHAACQENFSVDIQQLKKSIRNMEREISAQNRKICSLTSVVLSTSRHSQLIAESRKKLQYLENYLEMVVQRECRYATENQKLRTELTQLLNGRTRFNDEYVKLLEQLSSDKKYLFEIIDYAMRIFDSCIEAYDKIEYANKKSRRERMQFKGEYMDMVFGAEANIAEYNFLNKKQKERKLADMEPKELRRRATLMQKNMKKYSRYRAVFDKICQFTGENRIKNLTNKYKEQESVYYSYFTYANEMGYHMTLLNSSVNNLYTSIRNLRQDLRKTAKSQIRTIIELENCLLEKRTKNDELQSKCNQMETHIEFLIQEVASLYETTHMGVTPLMLLFGEDIEIDMKAMRIFLKQLEQRLLDIVSSVYLAEHGTSLPRDSTRSELELELTPPIDFLKRTIKGLGKFCEWPTALSDIVLTQQCAECAAGDAFVDSGDSSLTINPNTIKDTRRALSEKVVQPEMQYRLHSLQECRLPRSRALAGRKSLQNDLF